MRLMTVIVALAAAIYGGYWVAGRAAFDRGAIAAIEAARDAGVEVSHSGLVTRGFPSRFDTTLDAIAVDVPAYRLRWQAPFLQLLMLSYLPTRAIVVWPDVQTLSLPDQELTLATTGLRASVSVEPRPTLPLRAVTIEGGPLRLASDAGWWIGAESLLAALRPAPDTVAGDAPGYDLYVSADVIAPPETWRALADPKGELPPAIGSAVLSARITTDRPLDRDAAAGAAPLLTSVSFENSTMIWGSVHLTVNGRLEPDAAGLAAGTLMLTVRDWSHLVAAAAAADLIAPQSVAAWQDALDRLAAGGDSITAPLNFSGGQISLGFLTLAPAPRLR